MTAHPCATEARTGWGAPFPELLLTALLMGTDNPPIAPEKTRALWAMDIQCRTHLKGVDDLRKSYFGPIRHGTRSSSSPRTPHKAADPYIRVRSRTQKRNGRATHGQASWIFFMVSLGTFHKNNKVKILSTFGTRRPAGSSVEPITMVRSSRAKSVPKKFPSRGERKWQNNLAKAKSIRSAL